MQEQEAVWRDFTAFLKESKRGQHSVVAFHEGGSEENDPALITLRDRTVVGEYLVTVRVPEAVRAAIVHSAICIVNRLLEDVKASNVEAGVILTAEQKSRLTKTKKVGKSVKRAKI